MGKSEIWWVHVSWDVFGNKVSDIEKGEIWMRQDMLVFFDCPISFVVAFGPLWFIMGLFGFCIIDCFYLVGQIMTFCKKSKEVQDSLYIGKMVATDFDLLISWEIIKVKVTFGISYKGRDAFLRSQRVGGSH